MSSSGAPRASSLFNAPSLDACPPLTALDASLARQDPLPPLVGAPADDVPATDATDAEVAPAAGGATTEVAGGAATEEAPAADDEAEEVAPAAVDAAAEVVPAACAPKAATATVNVYDLKGLSGKVSALVDSYRAFSDKLDGLSDVLSSATSKLETHGRAVECFGSTMGGLTTSVRSLKICLQTRMPSPAGGGSGSEEDEKEAPGAGVVAIAGDVTAHKPDKPPASLKVRRVGGGAADVMSMFQHALLAKYAKADADARV